MQAYLWIGVGSALGGMARHWCSVAVAARLGVAFPWGTILVNVLGSFLIGALAALSAPDGRLAAAATVRPLLMAGFCGGYTTFSAFSLQTLELIRTGDWPAAAGNVALSVAACLAAVWLGWLAVAALDRPGGA